MKNVDTVRHEATERDLLFFLTPELWELHPFLPLVRHKPQGEMDCGILYDNRRNSGASDGPFTVFLTNLFMLPSSEKELLTLPNELYPTIEDLALSGWVVD